MKEKLYNWLTPLGWKRGNVRAFLALTTAVLFFIVIVGAILGIMLINNERVTFSLVIICILVGGLFSFNSGWYFGQRSYKDKEEPKKEFRGLPEVRTYDYEVDEEEAQKKRESQQG
jgi:hypothetical protein